MWSSGLITLRSKSVATAAYKAVVSSRLWPQQRLDDADVDLLLQQVGSEAVAQYVRRHPLVQTGHGRGQVDRPVELTRRHVIGSGSMPGNSQPSGRILP